VDVNGKAVEMAYDTNNSRQIVKDQLGYETIYVYDDRGNVLREIDAEGKITDRAYDANNWMLSETSSSKFKISRGVGLESQSLPRNHKMNESKPTLKYQIFSETP
jgi:YD repeat-containing protein